MWVIESYAGCLQGSERRSARYAIEMIDSRRVNSQSRFTDNPHPGHEVRLENQRGPKLLGLALRGLLQRLDLPLHRHESGGENGGSQLCDMLAVVDSGFDAVLDQLLLQFEEL
jgi:hypothetical protein